MIQIKNIPKGSVCHTDWGLIVQFLYLVKQLDGSECALVQQLEGDTEPFLVSAEMRVLTDDTLTKGSVLEHIDKGEVRSKKGRRKKKQKIIADIFLAGGTVEQAEAEVQKEYPEIKMKDIKKLSIGCWKKLERKQKQKKGRKKHANV